MALALLAGLVAIVLPVVEPQPAAATTTRYEGESYAGTCASGPSYSGASGGASANCTEIGQTAKFTGVTVPSDTGGRLRIVVRKHCCANGYFSYRIDEGSWTSAVNQGGGNSGWTAAVDAFNVLLPGSHTVEVRYDSGWSLYLDYIDVEPIPIVAAGEPEPWPSFDGYRAFCNISRSGSGPLHYYTNNSRNQPPPYTWVACNVPASINGTPVAQARYYGLAFIHENGGNYGFGCCLDIPIEPMQSEPGRWLSTRYGYATDNPCCNFSNTYILEDPKPHGDMKSILRLYNAAGTALYDIPAAQIRDEVVGVHEPGPPPWPHRYFAGATPPNPAISQAQTRGWSSHGRRTTARRADPVDTATGAFVDQVVDLGVPAAGVAFSFIRTYNSNDPTASILGTGWSYSFEASLTVGGNGDITVRTEDGAELAFTSNGSGGYARPPGITSTLAPVTEGYELTRADQVRYRFETSGRLLSVKDRSDKGVALGYDASNRLTTATDAAGRVFTFTYNPGGKLASVSAPAGDGRHVEYGYTGDLLTSVIDVSGGTSLYRYDAGNRLDQITDANGDYEVRNTYDANGRVTQQLDPLGNPTTFAWDAATQTSTMTDPKGKTWVDVYEGNVLKKTIEPNGTSTIGWDGHLNPAAGTDANGKTRSAIYDARGNVLTGTAPAPFSYTESLTYDARNNPLTYTDGRGNTTSYTYDPAGLLTTITHPGGATETRTYNAAGQPETVTDARTNTTTHTYDANGNLASVTTPLGNKSTFTYDAAGRPLTRVSPRGNLAGANPADYTTTWTYDGAGNVLTETDALGRTITSTYDANGNVLTRTDPLNRVTTYTYNDVGELVAETAPGNLTTTMVYDSRCQLVSVTTPTGAKTSYTYDDAGRMVAMVEARGNVAGANPADYRWTYGYDANGNQTTITDPLGHTTTQTYDALNRLVTVTDANNHTTTYGYDATSNRTSVTNHLNQATTWVYSARNWATSMTNPLAKTWTYGYDANGNQTSETAPLGAVTTRAYDADNRLTAVVDPLGNATGGVPADHDTLYGYDADGNQTSETDPLGRTTTFAFDRVGNRTGHTDALSHTTTWGFDALNRLTSVSTPASGSTTYAYNIAGDLVTRTDANNHTTTYGYDGAHRLTSLTSPTNQVWTYGYDPAGNRTTTVDAKANAAGNPAMGTTMASYDPAGRLVGIDYSDATPDVTFGYDNVSNRTSITDGVGTETRTYDGAGRLIAVTRGSDTFSYGYDAAGQLTSRTYPGAAATLLGYDNDGRLTSVAGPEGTTSYTYDVASRLLTTTLPNGVVESRTLDNANRLASITASQGTTTVASFAYTRDAVGNPTQVVAATGTQTYGYDAADRLTSVCYSASCPVGSLDLTTWTYDPVGNRLTETTGLATRTYSYNVGDELTSSTLGLVTSNYTYDVNGNQTAAGLDSFNYDMAGHMTSATTSAGTYTYTYDGEGKRVRTATTTPFGSTTTEAGWDITQPVPELAIERDGTGAITRRYGYGTERIATTTGSTTSFYVHDGLGSVANVMSLTGAKQWTYSYEPFGGAKTTTHDDLTAPEQPMRFVGEHQDPTGLYHLRARQYDPKDGRFTATDPLAPDLGDPYVSTYVYANDRPTVLVDPTGEKGRVVGAVGPNTSLFGWGRPGNMVDDGRRSGHYSYGFNWRIGTGNLRDAQALMSAIKNNPDRFFPFTVTPNRIKEGALLHLKGSEGLLGDPGDVLVRGQGSTWFGFDTRPGHVEGFPARVSFRIYSERGQLYFRVSARGPNGPLVDRLRFLNQGRYLIARDLWSHMAMNIRNYYGSGG